MEESEEISEQCPLCKGHSVRPARRPRVSRTSQIMRRVQLAWYHHLYCEVCGISFRVPKLLQNLQFIRGPQSETAIVIDHEVNNLEPGEVRLYEATVRRGERIPLVPPPPELLEEESKEPGLNIKLKEGEIDVTFKPGTADFFIRQITEGIFDSMKVLKKMVKTISEKELSKEAEIEDSEDRDCA